MRACVCVCVCVSQVWLMLMQVKRSTSLCSGDSSSSVSPHLLFNYLNSAGLCWVSKPHIRSHNTQQYTTQVGAAAVVSS